MYLDQVQRRGDPSLLGEPLLNGSYTVMDSSSPQTPNPLNAKHLPDGVDEASLSTSDEVEKYDPKSDESARRIYANNAPKIVLETITANTASIIIALTYIFFILGFSIDFYTTYRSFNSNNLRLRALDCDDTNTHINNGNEYYGCTDGNHWKAEITQRTNVLSVKLNVQRENITDSFFTNKTDDSTKIKYNIHLWACYNPEGCGSDYKTNTHYTKDPNVWQLVLKEQDVTINLNIDSDLKTNVHDSDGYKSNLIPTLFQNQEAIPTNGLVESYYINLDYEEDEYGIYSVADGAYPSDVKYYFDVVERPREPVTNCFFVILLVITLFVVCGYVYILWERVKMKKRVLSEQKWVLGYFLLLILFQNPVYVVIVWYKSSPPIGAAYASYVLGYIAQSGLFVLWLLFADSVHRKINNKFIFYAPKAFIGLAIFTVGICILTFQFPGLDPSDEGDSTRNAVEAVANWSDSLKNEFIGFTFTYLILIWVWTVWWFVHLFWTGRKLKKLPYMSTRYIQLSYRFFTLQATLVTLYYVFQYFAVMYFISAGTNSQDVNNTNFADNINIIFRQQTQLFGKTLFLTVYALILAFLFLPSELLDNSHGLLAALAATYVISENEHKDLIHQRKLLVNSMKKNILTQVTLMNQIINARIDVFCVDIALMMRSISFQAYYDPPGIATVSGFDGQMNLSKIGFTLIDTLYNKDHEVFCFVAREDKTGRLVVGFRGTASKRQMEDNLKYKQRAIDFYSLETDSLDQLDGLDFKPIAGENKFELESVDEDDEDLNIPSDNVDEEAAGPGAAFRRQQSEGQVDRGTTTIKDKAERVGGGMKKVLQGTVDVGAAVVGTTAGLMKTAAAKTPGLKNIVKIFVHSGFWEAYEYVRVFIHAILRRELARTPTTVFFSGHSLGGALATFAALDVSIHTIPRINSYLKHQEKLKHQQELLASDIERPSLFTALSRTFTSRPFAARNDADTTNRDSGGFVQRSSNSLPGGASIQMESPAASAPGTHRGGKIKFVNKLKVMMYNFGSPRVGNGNFAQMYDKIVPNSYRIVVDGDIVPALPPPGKYTHIGTEILIDSVGAGSIIIDPSFVERWLRTHMKSSVSVHSLLVYRKGLVGIKLAAEAMRDIAKNNSDLDVLRVGLQVRSVMDVDNVLDENAGVANNTTKPSGKAAVPPAATTSGGEINAGTSGEGKDDSDGSNGSKGSVNSSLDLLSKHGGNGNTVAEEKDVALGGEAISPSVSSDSFSSSQEKLHMAQDERIMDAFQTRLRDIRRSGPIHWIKSKAKEMGRIGRKQKDASPEREEDEAEATGTIIGSMKEKGNADGTIGSVLGRTTLSRIAEDYGGRKGQSATTVATASGEQKDDRNPSTEL